jgi:hypothetical protein
VEESLLSTRHFKAVTLWGKFLGLSGIVFALLGNGKLRWPACLISLVMVFMWLEASAFE